jgi:Xaa-Pro dipeptidase
VPTTDTTSAVATPSVSTEADVVRMQTDRNARLRAGMAAHGVDALVLLATGNVTYATGATWPLADAGRANVERPVAVVIAGDDQAHLFTPFRDAGASPAERGVGLDEGHVHGPVYLDFDEGVEAFAAVLAGLLPARAVVAVDDVTAAMHRNRSLLFAEWPPRAAGDVLGPARLVKTPDELAVMRHGLWIAEQAMADVQLHLAPGMHQTDLTARFLHRVFELGADANILDPIWQVMPDRQADLPWTVNGDIACPLLTTERELEAGDVLWVDTSMLYGGFHTDFGRTWIVGGEPSARQQAQYEQWRAINDAALGVLRAGVTGADLTAAARSVTDVETPWMAHFYLAHGMGLDSAEMPFIGSDLGDAFDATLVLEAGTIVVLEPVVWDEGHSGYRSENVYVVTDDGYRDLTDYPYDPYGD